MDNSKKVSKQRHLKPLITTMNSIMDTVFYSNRIMKKKKMILHV